MNTRSIYHFVGFITQLNQDAFVEKWSHYAGKFTSIPGSGTLYEKVRGNGKYKYLSLHAFSEEAFSFSFMKGRESENFPEQTAKVVTLGGYTPVDMGRQHPGTMKVFFFLNGHVEDIKSYYDGSDRYSLRAYQPFYENCLYDLILAFNTDEINVQLLIDEFMTRKESAEISVCRTCTVPQPVG